jgi:hypothetical protein
MRADYDISRFSPPIQVICKAMKKHGLIVADNGSNWYISGAPDPRWDDDTLGQLKTIPGSAFEVILTVDNQKNPIRPSSVIPRVARLTKTAELKPLVQIVNWRWNYLSDRYAGTGQEMIFSLQGRRIP